VRTAIGSLMLTALLCSSAVAQTAEKGITADPGVVAIRLIDREEVRASRIEIQPGATRRVHAHTDVKFHLFFGIKGTVQLTIGSEKPVEVKQGQAYFMKVGTPHGFKNATSEPAIAMEIFVKATASPVAANDLGALALAFAAMGDVALPINLDLKASSFPALP
jgi:quercetin dioxygenase-like cupin family protein